MHSKEEMKENKCKYDHFNMSLGIIDRSIIV